VSEDSNLEQSGLCPNVVPVCVQVLVVAAAALQMAAAFGPALPALRRATPAAAVQMSQKQTDAGRGSKKASRFPGSLALARREKKGGACGPAASPAKPMGKKTSNIAGEAGTYPIPFGEFRGTLKTPLKRAESNGKSFTK